MRRFETRHPHLQLSFPPRSAGSGRRAVLLPSTPSRELTCKSVELSMREPVVSSSHERRRHAPQRTCGSASAPARGPSRERFAQAVVHAASSLACSRVDDVRRVEARTADRLMDFSIRPTFEKVRPAGKALRCPQCRAEALVLLRRHVSPPRLGPPLVTEYYECECCEERYQYSPATNRWRRTSQ